MTLTLSHLYRGKVRDLYDAGGDLVLMVASDRLSAFDVVMAEPIPNKGRVLTAFTNYWLAEFGTSVPSALVSCDPIEIDRRVPGFLAETALHGRAMLVRRAAMLPIECIVRARMAGSVWAEYAKTGTILGHPAPPGLRLADPLPAPMFTPSTKVDEGHDRNIDLAEAAELVGAARLAEASALCLDLFSRAAARMAAAGLVLADTKFELGELDGRLVVCDEVITPDSSRIWPAASIVPGEAPPAYDKQPFRDWLDRQAWDRTPPPPPVPAEIVTETSRRYVAAYEAVTSRRLADWYGHGE